jgi:hypothetical protein
MPSAAAAERLFGPFLPKPRLPPLSRPVRFKYYLGGGQH